MVTLTILNNITIASIAQLGERKTEVLKVLGSIPSGGIIFGIFLHIFQDVQGFFELK